MSPRIFEEQLIIIAGSSGPGGMTDTQPKLQIATTADVLTLTDAATELLNVLAADTKAAMTETLKLSVGTFGDSLGTMSEAVTMQAIFTATGTWTCPAGVTSVTVHCRGGGQGGGAGSTTIGGTGGNGGDYVTSVLTVVPATVYTVTVGAISAVGGVGNDTWFNTATTIRAKGGGSASTNIGTTVFTGGVGAAGALLGTGGGGGGGAGDAGNGGNAVAAAGGTGGTAGGGTGGAGQTGAGSAGTAPGGGGGGGGGSVTSPGAGSTGSRGEERITWIAA